MVERVESHWRASGSGDRLASVPAAGLDWMRNRIVLGDLAASARFRDCSDSAAGNNRSCTEGNLHVPARKKQPTDAVAPAASGRKKTTTKKTTAKKSATATATAVTRAAGRKAPAKGGYDLVIVESPAKAKTINKYLGSNYRVLASYGHVRDLPRRRRAGEVIAGVDLDGWVPTYVVEDKDDKKGGHKPAFRRRSTKDILAELKREAAKAGHVFLATDPDREGEAIAWHIEDELKLDDARTFRITFNEITRSAVQQALAQPGKIDMDRVRAQEARRILDRVVGYPLSNLLGQKVTRGLSAGRVQSVAVRLIVEREREIAAFKPEEYWKIAALLAPQGTVPLAAKPYSVVLAKKKGVPSEGEAVDGEGAAKPQAVPEGTFRAELAEWNRQKFAAATEEQARAVAEVLDRAAYTVRKIEQKDQAQQPQAPFTTSTLQQQASLRLHFAASRTMQTAQKLYEGVELGGEGQIALITYMRTDSTRVSADALEAVRGHIQAAYGDRYLPAKPNVYASGKSAQEAHEAIRPTDVAMTPQRAHQLGLHGDPLRLYTLIFNRFVASQMTPAIFAVTNVEVEAVSREPQASGVLKAQGRIQKFDGFLRVMPGHKREDALLPHLSEGQPLDRLELTASQHFTEPPPRYNEASLVKALEKEGIGRPSTYASIISTIQHRGYVEQKDRRFYATEIGQTVTDLLVQHFPKVMDVKFTSHFEEELDDIAERKAQYVDVLNEFWGPFSQALDEAKTKMGPLKGQETGELCPKCGKPLVQQFSRKTRGPFVGCSGWKEGCKYIKPREGEPERPDPIETEHACPTCGRPMVQRMSRRGPFLGCSGYPECKTTMNLSADGQPVVSAQPTAHKCDKCGSPMVIRQGRRGPFLACTAYPKCKNALDVDAHGNPIRPVKTGIRCEKCGSEMIVKKGPRGPFLACSGYPKCRSYKPLPAELRERPEVKALLEAQAVKKAATPQVEVTETCPDCGSAMKLRPGRGGSYFLGCSKYPRCKGTRELSEELLEKVSQSAGMA
jgi:DNA topoisomerase-1